MAAAHARRAHRAAAGQGQQHRLPGGRDRGGGRHHLPLARGARRAIGDLRLEVVDYQRKVVASAVSASDGYYVITGIFPGEYFLRVAPEQLKRLGLTDTGMHMITIGKDGTVLNGRDLDVRAEDEA